MKWFDWLILLLPVCFIMYMGYYSRRYIRGVADFLSAGRLCGRYVICVADMANALSIIGLIAFVEVSYKTGFALNFWRNLTVPVAIFMGLTGFCFYRFRETKAMSLGQFLEMRYNRVFRIFAASLRSISEMLANMIMPAVGARFFIYFLDLPTKVMIFGRPFPTFMILTLLILTIAVSLICMGGTLAVVITDTIQGMFCYPLLIIFVIFVLCKFSWSEEIIPVMQDRIAGESFLNPYDIENLRDFNPFLVAMGIITSIVNHSVWIGAGNTSAARNAHEQKMANLLGQWRGILSNMFYLLIAVTIIVLLNHKNFAPEAKQVRDKLTRQVVTDLVKDDKALRDDIIATVSDIPELRHEIGVEAPLSQTRNLDSLYLDTVHRKLLAGQLAAARRDNPDLSESEIHRAEGQGNALFQQFRTLFHQMMMAATMRRILPPGMLGMFCLLLVMAMISTDDSRMYSAALTIAQDVVLPLKKKPFTPKQHLWMIRIITIGVGVFFFIGSFFMAQLDYINLYIGLMTLMWTGGSGAVMCFGFYSRFGTTAGAFTSIFTSIVLGIGGIFCNRNWADVVYPFLRQHNWVEPVGNFLAAASRPFNPYVVWEMNPVKCPVNTWEMMFITVLCSMLLYVLVSLAQTTRFSLRPFGFHWRKDKLFNLERMLHRGKYAIDGEVKTREKWTFRNFFSKLIGITPEYTTGDRVIAWGLFGYSIVLSFFILFVAVFVWNSFSRWPAEWWSGYFFVTQLAIPLVMAAISTVWFTAGGIIDLRQLFRDLRNRIVNPLDDGRVEGNMSLADKAQLEAIDRKDAETEKTPNGD